MNPAVYVVVAPKWRRTSFHPIGRYLLRWMVVRETRHGIDPASGIATWGYQRISAHWTYRAAQRVADRLMGAGHAC